MPTTGHAGFASGLRTMSSFRDLQLTFDAASVYAVEVNAAGESDRVDMDDTASLAGTVRALPEAGDYGPETDYAILTATDPTTTTFDAVETTSAVLDPILLYLGRQRNADSENHSGAACRPGRRTQGCSIAERPALGSSDPRATRIEGEVTLTEPRNRPDQPGADAGWSVTPPVAALAS